MLGFLGGEAFEPSGRPVSTALPPCTGPWQGNFWKEDRNSRTQDESNVLAQVGVSGCVSAAFPWK